VKWVAKWFLHWLAAAAKKFPDNLAKGFLNACGAFAGLVASDNLLGFTKTPHSNEIALGIAGVVSLIGLLSTRGSWGAGYRKLVMRQLAWMFGAMGIIILGVGAERQLDVLNGLTISVYNVWVVLFLFVAMAYVSPLFMFSDWTRDALDYIGSKFKGRTRVSSIFED